MESSPMALEYRDRTDGMGYRPQRVYL